MPYQNATYQATPRWSTNDKMPGVCDYSVYVAVMLKELGIWQGHLRGKEARFSFFRITGCKERESHFLMITWKRQCVILLIFTVSSLWSPASEPAQHAPSSFGCHPSFSIWHLPHCHALVGSQDAVQDASEHRKIYSKHDW